MTPFFIDKSDLDNELRSLLVGYSGIGLNFSLRYYGVNKYGKFDASNNNEKIGDRCNWGYVEDIPLLKKRLKRAIKYKIG